MSQQTINGSQIADFSITDREISPSAAFQESKIAFAAVGGHDHDVVGTPTPAVLIVRQLRPTPSATPDLNVRVAASAGVNFPSGVTPSVPAQAFSFASILPLPSFQRIDLLYLDSGGLVQVRLGVPVNVSPVPPSRDGVYPIAEIGPLTSSTTAITSGLIKDARPFLSANPLTRVQQNGTTLGYAHSVNFSTNLSASLSGGVATITATGGSSVVDASSTTKGISRVSVDPSIGVDPVAVETTDPRMTLASNSIQKDGSVAFTGSQSFGGHNISAVGTFSLAGPITFSSTATIQTQSAGDLNLSPAAGGKVKVNSTTALLLPSIAGVPPNPNVGDIWYASSTDDVRVRTIGGPKVISAFVLASDTVIGNTRLNIAPASSVDPVALGANSPVLPTQTQKDALAGTSGTPSNSNRYVTDADVRVTTITANIQAALAGTNGTPSGGDKFVTDSDPRLPTANQKAALAGFGTAGPSGGNLYVLQDSSAILTANQQAAIAGSAGTPASGNKFVTQQDPGVMSAGVQAAVAGSAGTPGGGNKFVTQQDTGLVTANQKAALAGTAGSPSGANKYVTDQDTRLLTVDQEAALAGSAGAPTSSNKFVTQSDINYVLIDGSRAFLNPVAGSDPVLSNHLATKNYVDNISFVGTPVEGLTALEAVGPASRSNNQLRFVELDEVGNGTLYYFDNEASGGGVPPNSGPGQWFPVGAKAAAHATTHQNGGSDQINVGGLSGQLAGAQKVVVKDHGTTVGTVDTINIIGAGSAVLNGSRVDVDPSGGSSGLSLQAITTNATVTTLTTDGNPASGSNIPTIATSTAHAYSVTIAARSLTSGVLVAMIILRAALDRSSGGTVTLPGTVEVDYVYRSNTNLTATIAADDMNKGLNVNVTGLSSTHISWTAAVSDLAVA